MIDVNKRVVEVETILEKLDTTYKNKIPKELWDFIKQNKDTDYSFYYDEENSLINQTLNTDTVAILTYINMEYLLNEKQKQDIKHILINDESISEKKKKELYNPDNLFKNKATKVETVESSVAMVEYNESIFTKIKNWFKRTI